MAHTFLLYLKRILHILYDSVGKGKYDADCKLSVEETERIVRIFIFYSEFIPSFALPHSEEGGEEIVVVTFTAT